MVERMSSSQAISSKKPQNLFVPRVTQLDAVSLDKEINNVVKSQVVGILQLAHPDLLAKWEPEVEALLALLIWKISVLETHATFGQQLLGIKYLGQSRRRVWGLAALLVGGKYIFERARSLLGSEHDSPIASLVSEGLRWSRVAVQAASLLNTALFLAQGRFPTLADRLLGLRPVPASESLNRTVGYTYMTRELLWHGFIELLVFVLPLVNYRALSGRVRSLLRRDKSQSPDFGSIPPRLDGHSSCAVCSLPPVLPHHIGCGHVFCAYCIEASVLADPRFECPLCGWQAEYNVRPVHL